ncbi:hypothetical protein ES703_124562 [subsurface metagenome]
MHGLSHRPAFGYRQAQGLLAVNILAGLRRHNYRYRVPVVRCGDANRVDIIPGNHLAKINVRITALEFAGSILPGVVVFDDFAGRLPAEPRPLPAVLIPVTVFIARLYDVADGGNLHIGLTQKRPHVVRAHAAYADTAHSNSIARSDVTGLTKGRRRNKIRKTNHGYGRTGCFSQKLTS